MDHETELMFELCKRKEPVPGRTLIADGWVYRDIPERFSHELWDYFLERIGDGNYVILAMTETPDYKRGQLLISPAGITNLTNLTKGEG